MKTRETNAEFAERVRHLPRLERKRLIAERMTPQEEAELLRDSTVAVVLGAIVTLCIIIF